MSVYLDYQAARPVDDRVLAEMLPYFKEKFANPSSLHGDGDIATDILEKSREKIANFINAPNSSDIIFTSSATESNNLALIGAAMNRQKKGDHIIISEIEHISILNLGKYLERQGFKVSRIPFDMMCGNFCITLRNLNIHINMVDRCYRSDLVASVP